MVNLRQAYLLKTSTYNDKISGRDEPRHVGGCEVPIDSHLITTWNHIFLIWLLNPTLLAVRGF